VGKRLIVALSGDPKGKKINRGWKGEGGGKRGKEDQDVIYSSIRREKKKGVHLEIRTITSKG